MVWVLTWTWLVTILIPLSTTLCICSVSKLQRPRCLIRWSAWRYRRALIYWSSPYCSSQFYLGQYRQDNIGGVYVLAHKLPMKLQKIEILRGQPLAALVYIRPNSFLRDLHRVEDAVFRRCEDRVRVRARGAVSALLLLACTVHHPRYWSYGEHTKMISASP